MAALAAKAKGPGVAVGTGTLPGGPTSFPTTGRPVGAPVTTPEDTSAAKAKATVKAPAGRGARLGGVVGPPGQLRQAPSDALLRPTAS